MFYFAKDLIFKLKLKVETVERHDKSTGKIKSKAYLSIKIAKITKLYCHKSITQKLTRISFNFS